MANEFPLSLVVRAVDKVTGPLRGITAKLNALTSPARNLGKSFAGLNRAAGFGELASGVAGVGSAVKNVASEAFSLGAKFVAMATAAGFALYSIVRGTVDAGDKLSEMSKRVGIGVDSYASLQYAAAQADVEQEAFNNAMDQFNKRLGEAKAGGGSLLGFLEKVSPALANQVQHAKGTEAALSLMTAAFTKIKDPAKLAALAAEAFGKSGLQMGTFLAQGSAEIQKQQLEYLRLAGSQAEFARQSDDLDNVLRDSETAMLGVRAAVATALYPAVTKIAKAVTEFMVAHRDGLAKWATETGKAITDWVDGGGIERLIAGVKDLAGTITRAVEFVGGFKTVLAAVAVVMAGPLISAVVAVVPAVYALGAALLTTPVGWFLLAVGAIAGAVYLIYKNWAGIKDFFSETFGGVMKVFEGFQEIVRGVLTFNVGSIFEGWTKSVDGFKDALRGAKDILAWIKGDEAGAFQNDQERNKKFFDTNGPRQSLDTATARPGASRASEATVNVSFSNVPKGVRVATDPNSSANVSTDVGYSMGPT